MTKLKVGKTTPAFKGKIASRPVPAGRPDADPWARLPKQVEPDGKPMRMEELIVDCCDIFLGFHVSREFNHRYAMLFLDEDGIVEPDVGCNAPAEPYVEVWRLMDQDDSPDEAPLMYEHVFNLDIIKDLDMIVRNADIYEQWWDQDVDMRTLKSKVESYIDRAERASFTDRVPDFDIVRAMNKSCSQLKLNLAHAQEWLDYYATVDKKAKRKWKSIVSVLKGEVEDLEKTTSFIRALGTWERRKK